MVKVKTDNLDALYDRDVLPTLVLQEVVVVVVVLLLMVGLNPDLRPADLGMMDQEDLVMMHLEDLAMMHLEVLAMMHQEVPVTKCQEGLVMKLRREDLVMMHREEQLMMQPEALTTMHRPEWPRVLMDRCHLEIMPLTGLQHHQHVREVGMRQPLEAGTQLGDEEEEIMIGCLVFDEWTCLSPSFTFVFFGSSQVPAHKIFVMIMEMLL